MLKLPSSISPWRVVPVNLPTLSHRPSGQPAVRRWPCATATLAAVLSTSLRGQRVVRRALGSSPWEILGVAPGATPAEVKKAYRRKALKEHPDVSKLPDAKQRWQELSAAYDALSDPEKLKAWERAQRGASAGTRSRTRTTGASARDYDGRWRRTQEMEEKYDAGGDTFGAIFSDFFDSLAETVPFGGKEMRSWMCGCAVVAMVIYMMFFSFWALVYFDPPHAAVKMTTLDWCTVYSGTGLVISDCASLICHWVFARKKRYCNRIELCRIPNLAPTDIRVKEICGWVCLGILTSVLVGWLLIENEHDRDEVSAELIVYASVILVVLPAAMPHMATTLLLQEDLEHLSKKASQVVDDSCVDLFAVLLEEVSKTKSRWALFLRFHFALGSTAVAFFGFGLLLFERRRVHVSLPITASFITGPLAAAYLLMQIQCLARFNAHVSKCKEHTQSDTMHRLLLQNERKLEFRVLGLSITHAKIKAVMTSLIISVCSKVADGSESRVRRATRAGGMLLEDLLEFLEQGLGEDANRRGSRGSDSPFAGSDPESELQEAQLEFKTMQSRDEILAAEANAWERKSELCRSSGDKTGELDAMQRLFDTRERRKTIRRRLLSIQERKEYLEKVLFEFKRKQETKSTGASGSAGSSAGTSSRTTRTNRAPNFDADQALAELKKQKGKR
eukprot:symbB.v1.2.018319.t1/scaffold1456.1/size117650/9